MGTSKHNKFKERIIKNSIGDDVHIFTDDKSEVRIKKISMFDKCYTGKQYCPDCHKEIKQLDGYFECPICFYSITNEEAEHGDGYQTLESTYIDDYGSIYISDFDSSDNCENCDGPFPDCSSSCELYDE